MAGIPQDIVDRIRGEANIVDVVSDYVRLRRAGKNWLGLCPFHEDRKPSLTVEPIKGIYKCFACGKGGNVFTFLAEINGWTFPEAVRYLAGQLGIEIPEHGRERKDLAESERLIAVVADAAAYYRDAYQSPRGEAARAYFRKRGIGEEVAARFHLGFAPDEWEGLLTFLTARGYTPDELARSGLAIQREEHGRWYDRFRGRALFPISSPTGRIVGFGARRMSEDPDQPKYINSPETPIYHKSRLLYGLFQAKDSIRRRGVALLVEGYVDVIALHQGGIANAIAPCGTSLTSEHASLLSRFAGRVVLVFDSDAAGESATARGIDVLLRRDLDVYVLRLPDGEDPDSFVRNFGAKELERRIESSSSFLDFRARQLKASGAFDAPEQRAEAIRSIVGTISMIPDPLKRELYAQKIASDYFLPEALVQAELARSVGEGSRRSRNRLPQSPARASTPATEQAGSLPPTHNAGESGRYQADIDAIPAAERELLGVLLQGEIQLLDHVFAQVSDDDFSHPLSRGLVKVIRAHYENQHSFSIDDLIVEELEPSLRELSTLLAIERETISSYWSAIDPMLPQPNPWKIARDCLVRIEHACVDGEIRRIQQCLVDSDLDETEERKILERFRVLRAKAEDLKHLISG